MLCSACIPNDQGQLAPECHREYLLTLSDIRRNNLILQPNNNGGGQLPNPAITRYNINPIQWAATGFDQKTTGIGGVTTATARIETGNYGNFRVAHLDEWFLEPFSDVTETANYNRKIGTDGKPHFWFLKVFSVCNVGSKCCTILHQEVKFLHLYLHLHLLPTLLKT